MNRRIYKYELATWIKIHEGAHILSVGVQGNTVYVWALVDATLPLVWKQMHLIGTGHPLPSNLGRFIGMVQLEALVFHIFEASDQ